MVVCFFFQAEDGIRDLVRSRGLGDVYKRQPGLSRLVGSRADLMARRAAYAAGPLSRSSQSALALSLIHI